MSTLYLIRHGQASFGAADYDVLSALGAEQARHLGAHWARRDARIDAVYTGPLVRQRDTTGYLREAARAEGVHLPEAACLAELDEYPAFRMLGHWLPILSEESPEFRGALDAYRGSDAGSARARRRQFERAFEFIVQKWARGELATEGVETFAEFQARVRSGLGGIMAAQGRGKHVAVVTSAGPIAMALQWALGLGDENALATSWVIGNASITEFRYREADSLTLVRFNTVPHLQDEGLITYR